jgi:hypothetical protein
MTALLTADLHFSDNPRDAYRFDFMPWFRDLAKKRKSEVAFVLGDLTEEKDRHSAALVNRVVDSFHALAQVCPVVIDQGNHDYLGDPRNAFYRFLAQIEGITWVSTPIGESFPGVGSVLYLPHALNYEEAWKGLQFKNYDWILAHNTFEGADAGHGRKMSGIPSKIFPKDAQVISGDIHIPQSFDVITYVGAPYTVDFGDDYDPRILQLNGDGSKESIPVPGVQKRLIEITSLGQLDKLKGVHEGDILKVRLKLPPDMRTSWPEMQDEVRKWGLDAGVVIHAVQPMTDATMLLRQKAEQRAPRTDEELMKAYAAKTGIDKRTLETGLELMK